MTADLLERDSFLLALNEALRQAAEGHGRTALVSGEAGIGKTSLVERFIAQAPAGVRTLWGACEALFTPRPLGPLYDIAQQAQTPLRAALENEANRATLFAAVLDELTHDAAPMMVVIEDIHWADEATLDLIKYLARRIHQTSSLLILTYRDDEIDRGHPLRLVLGDLPARDVTRLRLPPSRRLPWRSWPRRLLVKGTNSISPPAAIPSLLPKRSPAAPQASPRVWPTRCSRASHAALLRRNACWR